MVLAAAVLFSITSEISRSIDGDDGEAIREAREKYQNDLIQYNRWKQTQYKLDNKIKEGEIDAEISQKESLNALKTYYMHTHQTPLTTELHEPTPPRPSLDPRVGAAVYEKFIK